MLKIPFATFGCAKIAGLKQNWRITTEAWHLTKLLCAKPLFVSMFYCWLDETFLIDFGVEITKKLWLFLTVNWWIKNRLFKNSMKSFVAEWLIFGYGWELVLWRSKTKSSWHIRIQVYFAHRMKKILHSKKVLQISCFTHCFQVFRRS